MNATIEKSGILTREEVENDPQYAGMLEAIQWLEAHENDWIFPQKDVAAYMSTFGRDLRKHMDTDPYFTFKEALLMALEPVPKSLDSEWMLDIVFQTLEKWEKIKAGQFAEVAA